MQVSNTSQMLLGSFLDDLQNRINGSINQVINSAENAVEFEIEVAGRQVNIAIENAKMAYLDIS